MRVLIIEDEESLTSAIARGLRLEGIAVDVALDGAGALDTALVTAYDVVVLDRNLRGARRRGLPALAAAGSKRGADADGRRGLRDQVAGLDLGADDYLGKPFAF